VLSRVAKANTSVGASPKASSLLQKPTNIVSMGDVPWSRSPELAKQSGIRHILALSSVKTQQRSAVRASSTYWQAIHRFQCAALHMYFVYRARCENLTVATRVVHPGRNPGDLKPRYPRLGQDNWLDLPRLGSQAPEPPLRAPRRFLVPKDSTSGEQSEVTATRSPGTRRGLHSPRRLRPGRIVHMANPPPVQIPRIGAVN
jgi:hypothetical protein